MTKKRNSRLRRLALSAGLLLLGVRTAAAEPALPPFAPGEQVTAVGDSITHWGYYLRALSDFYCLRAPAAGIRFANAGIAGDTVGSVLARYESDVLPLRGTYYLVMLGMNDVGRNYYGGDPADPARQARRDQAAAQYRARLDELCVRLKHTRAKVAILSPTAFDETVKNPAAAPNLPGCDAGLARLTAIAREVASRHGFPFLDLHTPMRELTLAMQRRDPAASLVLPDRVHPHDAGALFLAAAIITAQGAAAAPVWSAAVDARAGTTTASSSCRIDQVTKSGDGIAFTQTDAPLAPAYDHLPPELAAAIAPLTRAELKVTALPAGEYELNVDGVSCGRYSAAALAAGVDPLLAPTHPDRVRAQEAMQLNRRRVGLERIQLRNPVAAKKFIAQERLRRQGKAPLPEDERAAAQVLAKEQGPSSRYQQLLQYGTPEGIAATRAAMAKLETEMLQLARPRPHRYELRRSGP